ncbi:MULTISPECIES: toll/interleukin-1 receptor domain-containing protein [unclassified Corallococcus]|uniref:toll/interleukin-1 receptor domain-containing protein n=1 Tax=unclassified Corallococcus TaxID=2685029 RepID=UPI001A8FE065|nr:MULTISPECIES: toll/interleukin-1 receptor domain-containing protein [unclassified Corallococcus]MBN9687112.1 toll/interleukin-1 receptor domain-containing protein [Corallococcus sp. NCSPR001]WAS89060.1 toll/interleukin-1 receptor domain-containing protein [Corallococcus sp. NCRR]
MDLYDTLLTQYADLVSKNHQHRVHTWPVLSGCNRMAGGAGQFLIVVFRHTGNTALITSDNMSEMLVRQATQNTAITDGNKEAMRQVIRRSLLLNPSDLVLLIKSPRPVPADIKGQPLTINAQAVADELKQALRYHEQILGLLPMKIFLSHKGVDKEMVRDFKSTLLLLGFSPWLDEDAMPAGTSLERGILKGFEDSCAAVFFVTPNFVDEKFLATEVDYAIQQKRAKGDAFSIITLVFKDSTSRGTVPQLLRPYVWKEPSTQLQGLREILVALPIQVGEVRLKA